MTTIDVSRLPRYAFGRRSALFWGVVLFVAIESTALAIMFTAYLYVRGNFDVWPPSAPLSPAIGILTTVAMLASCVPMQLALGPCRRLELRPTRRRVLVGVAIGALSVALRVWELRRVPFLWSENAYASIVWTTYGMHTIELGASVLEAAVMVAVLFRGPIEDKHYEDVEVTALFWYFACLVWLPFAALFYVDGSLR